MKCDSIGPPLGKLYWCVICGEVMGHCDHEGPYTDNLETAYQIWMEYRSKRRNQK